MWAYNQNCEVKSKWVMEWRRGQTCGIMVDAYLWHIGPMVASDCGDPLFESQPSL